MTDTDYAFGASKPSILVDWDILDSNAELQHWLRGRAGIFNLVILVTYPNERDYPSGEFTDAYMQADTVIRNTGYKTDLAFKLHALSILRDVSSSAPVVAVDGNFLVRKEFGKAGLVVLSERDFV